MKLFPLLNLGLLVIANLASAASPILVDSSSSTPVFTSFNLLAGHTYQVKVQGTFTYNLFVTDYSTTFMADADWCWNQATKDGSWTERWPDPNVPDYFMHLLINGAGPTWLGTTDLNPGPNSVFTAHTYSPSHVYQTEVVGQGAPLSFMVYDNPYWYDNVGSLSVSVIEVPEPAACGLLALGLGAFALRRCRKS